MAKSGKKTCFDAGKIGFCHCAWVLKAQEQKMCIDLDLSLLYILILGTYSEFARKNNFLALGVYCPAISRRLMRAKIKDTKPHLNQHKMFQCLLTGMLN